MTSGMGTLVGYFARSDDAHAALRELREEGYLSTGLIFRSATGSVRIWNHRLSRRLLLTLLPAITVAIAAGLARWLLPQTLLPWTRGSLIPVLLGAGLGVIIGLLLALRSRTGVRRSVLVEQARWVMADETALVIEAAIDRLRFAVPLLRKGREIPPALFVLHPERTAPAREGLGLPPPHSITQMQEHARRMAADHHLIASRDRDTSLLSRVDGAREWVHRVCADLSQAQYLEQSTTPAAEWILDNEYIVESNARDVQLNLPRRFYRQLPALANEPYRALPRAYALAKELVTRMDLRVDRGGIIAFLEAYQSVSPLTIGELWAIPQMLRTTLIEGIENLATQALEDLREREMADFWANRLLTATRRGSNELFAMLAELANAHPRPSSHFGSQLVGHLYDETAALIPVQGWLERVLRRPLGDTSIREQNRQTRQQISIGNAFTSLRQLARLDWRPVFERLSQVEQILRRDPSDVYRRMHFDTRNRYREIVELLARRSKQPEGEIARLALEMAARHEEPPAADDRSAHIGAYLVGPYRQDLTAALRCSESPRFRLLQALRRHHSGVYLVSVGMVTAVLVSLFVWIAAAASPPGLCVLLGLLLLIPASQLAVEVVNYTVTRLLEPQTLPRLNFRRSGIPAEFRTLVVVPTLLVDARSIQSEIENLEIRYLANRDDNVLFALFSDFADSDEIIRETDRRLLRLATESVEALNERYDGERFFLLHRERTWSESEQCYLGWERKRGKLEELNQFLAGTRAQDAPQLVHVGDPDSLLNTRFVITLDSDTQLPLGTARKMIETLAHPLNQPRFDAGGRIAPGSYTIIQPRVSPSLPSTSATLFSRLFADAVGIDPYTRAVSDVYQDLAGEGSYHGKGIYDVRAFSRILSGCLPEAQILSHDLLEGTHVRVGLASDIELYDEFPKNYVSYAHRQHRWTRGDWQIADWIFPRVPGPGGDRRSNPLSLFDRWKIFDNLRRSLLRPTGVGLLVTAWLISPQAGIAASLAVGLQPFLQPLSRLASWITTRNGWKSFSIPQLAHDLLRALVEIALLPHQAGLALDAIVRSTYRRAVSHRRLLEWTSAQIIGHRSRHLLPTFALSMASVSLFVMGVGWAVATWLPSSTHLALPWLGLWFASPLIGWILNLHPEFRARQFGLPLKDVIFLRRIARRTWRYFDDFVTEETSWLPPDNYQVSHQDELAMRTSPTNIGLWMLSTLAAHDFGYITTDGVTRRLSQTLETLSKLECFEGHLLNWYDIQTLSPLEPRYVSSVDSGNLLGALWTLEQGLLELLDASILQDSVFEGFRDTREVLREALGSHAEGSTISATIDGQLSLRGSLPKTSLDAVGLLRRLHRNAEEILQTISETLAGTEAEYWARRLVAQIRDRLAVVERQLGWVEILEELDDVELANLGADVLLAVREDLRRSPSLTEIAGGYVRCIPMLRSLRGDGALSEEDARWLDRVLSAFESAKRSAEEAIGEAHRVLRQVRKLSASINLRFLYDRRRRLFAVGYNVSDGQQDNAYYDLLASEARVGSFVAIARGDVPVEHWFAMSRPYGSIGRRRVLLSWTGTLFEYLMPLIFQRSYPNTLLDKATREAVTVQRAYGRKRKAPWGISESAYGDLDLQRTYQYKAFGVPHLGLKHGLEEQVVVAPYATLLAVGVSPAESIQNLRRLTGLDLLSDYGFFEAIDFGRRPTREAARGVIVRAYMAHHQGMGFLALANALHGNPFQRRFHADARIRSVEALLHERVPVLPPLHHISTRERLPTVSQAGAVAPSESRFDTPHTATPKTQLLCSANYSLMLTHAGGGYSRWGDIDITRWRSDRTRDSWGTFCYIHDVDARRLWSTTHHPVGAEADEYSARFALDRAIFHRIDQGIEAITETIVSPEDDVEIRRVTLVNRSLRTRRLDLTSYIELALAPHRSDRQHPAFNKLFIETEAVPSHRALLARRRPRSEDDPPVFAAHRFTVEGGDAEPLQFETDRNRFIVRGQTLADPAGARRPLENSSGYVLDPILSLRQTITLAMGERARLSMVLAAGSTRSHVLGLMDKYGDPHAIERAMNFAWASAQLELRLLRIRPDDARRFQQLASHMLYPGPLLRPPSKRLRENRKGQAGLWAYGISGDLPIAIVTIGMNRDIGLVTQMLQAHAYWRMHGLKADLVILDEEADAYEQPLHEALERLVQAHSMHTGIDQPGGVFLRKASQIPDEDLTLMMAAAHVILVATRGALAQQLSAASVPASAARRLVVKPRTSREIPAPLPYMKLPYFNGIGGFSEDGREYVIYLGPGTHTPAPWVNVLANPSFGTIVSETGSGFTWFGNSQRNRLTEWSNDPVLDPPPEIIYLRDEETGDVWTPTPGPVREESAYRIRHSAGCTIFEHNSHGIEQQLTVFVPVDDQGGETVKLQTVRLKNSSQRPRSLSLTYFVSWVLGESREDSQTHVITHWEEELGVLTASNPYTPDYGARVAFATLSPRPEAHSGDRTAFIGRNRSVQSPLAMEQRDLSGETGPGLDPCAALRVSVELAPGESTEITCILGQADSHEEAARRVQAYRETHSVERLFTTTRAWWDALLGRVEVHTPELSTDFLMNRWLPVQSLACRMWGRSAVYQSGGAFGFRDQLQDVMAFVHSAPDLAREQILRAAAHQFEEGDVQHWWHPPSGAGIRSRISDDLLWLPYVVSHYVRTTGDAAVLEAKAPFLRAPQLDPDQHEAYLIPEVTAEHASLFEHCRRAVERGLTSGPHGLPLIGTGDWNDGMNLVGAGGKGESVWLGWFLVSVLEGMIDLSTRIERVDLVASYEERRSKLIRAIEAEAWDGEWYLRATFDDGSPLGSSANTEARIDSLPQSWAWLSNAADPERAAQALESAWVQLVDENEGLVLLFSPPFDRSDPSPGYIKGYPPGVRENGGQYTHAAIWLAMALARAGDGNRAAKVLRMLNPIEHAHQVDAVRRYVVEPYVVAADVYRLPGLVGRGGWSWYTGSAAWMYRAWLEEILGITLRNGRLHVAPVIPDWWDGFRVTYRLGESVYEIEVENPENRPERIAWVELDGQRVPEASFAIDRSPVTHRVHIRMGPAPQPASPSDPVS